MIRTCFAYQVQSATNTTANSFRMVSTFVARQRGPKVFVVRPIGPRDPLGRPGPGNGKSVAAQIRPTGLSALEGKTTALAQDRVLHLKIIYDSGTLHDGPKVPCAWPISTQGAVGCLLRVLLHRDIAAIEFELDVAHAKVSHRNQSQFAGPRRLAALGGHLATCTSFNPYGSFT